MAESEHSDALTIGAIAVSAYVIATMLHEGLGHGGACVLTRGKLIYVSTVASECERSSDDRLVTAAGTLMNGIMAAVCFLLARMTSPKAARFRFFLWLSMAVNLFTAAGYFLFSGIGGFGDWAQLIRGLEPQWAWRVGMATFGAVAYMLAGWLILLEMRPLIGSDKDQRLARAKRLATIAYFTGGVLSCIAGSLNPEGFLLVALSAAAFTFGGTSGILWTGNFFQGNRISLGQFAEPTPLRRSWAWIGAASVLAVVFVAFVGPSVRFH